MGKRNKQAKHLKKARSTKKAKFSTGQKETRSLQKWSLHWTGGRLNKSESLGKTGVPGIHCKYSIPEWIDGHPDTSGSISTPRIDTARRLALMTRSQMKPAIDARKSTPLKTAVCPVVRILKGIRLPGLLTTIDLPYKAYTLTCMTISMDHKLRAPSIRVRGSIATHLTVVNERIRSRLHMKSNIQSKARMHCGERVNLDYVKRSHCNGIETDLVKGFQWQPEA